MDHSQLKLLPSVGNLLEDERINKLVSSGSWVKLVVQSTVDTLRRELLAGSINCSDRNDLIEQAVKMVEVEYKGLTNSSMRKVINATGVVVHTNLGRSVYSERAVEWMNIAATGNVDLEMDLVGGSRGHRGRGVEKKASLLAGSEDALIVNNNAAALWLAVRTAAGKNGKIILSRGEIVAIGGSFKLHEILSETDCDLIEVGTTNRTTVEDYRNALTENAVVLKVHRSNFSLNGFTEEASVSELAALCQKHGNIMIYDAGSGLLHPSEDFGLPAYSVIKDDIATGADLVTCSGDKLFGGGQCGIIFGKTDLVKKLRDHPLRRAVRVDKTSLAALDGTLHYYLTGSHLQNVPTLKLMRRSLDEMKTMAEQLGAKLDLPDGWDSEVISGKASVGGGSFSEAILDSILLLIKGPHSELEKFHYNLRVGDPSILVRISKDGIAVDFRSVPENDIPLIADLFSSAFERGVK